MYHLTLMAMALIGAGATAAHAVEGGEMAQDDTFYQYQIPVTIEAPQAGWQVVPIIASQITGSINALEEMSFDPIWFACNQVRLTVHDPKTGAAKPLEDAGFYLVAGNDELLPDDILTGEPQRNMAVEPGGMYVLRYTTSGGRSPAMMLEPVFPAMHKLRANPTILSHEPAMLPIEPRPRDVLLRAGSAKLPLVVGGSHIGKLTDISLRRATIALLVRLDSPGTKHLTLHYQPLTGHYLSVPTRRRDALPQSTATVQSFGPATKHLGDTRYAIANSPVWFADTTVKLTPDTPAPSQTRNAIRISAAANEAQSFQLVLRPQHALSFKNIRCSTLRSNDNELPAEVLKVQRLAYVPITQPSFLSPVTYRGAIGDPLVPAEPATLDPADGNAAFWLTLTVPSGTKPGVYAGTLTLDADDGPITEIPLEVKVYAFELPAVSPFRSSMGGPHLTKSYKDYKNIADYHHVSDKEDIQALAHAYFDVMSANKFTPLNVAQYTDIGLAWTPPPQGMNVDAPNNFFTLHDWDFTALNATLAHYIDDLKVNNLGIIHTNPSFMTLFKHLPGKPLETYSRHPPHATLDWQNWREATLVGYGKRAQDTYTEITQAQFDNLVMQFYRAFAENLEVHGWLDTAYILVDETHDRGYEPFLHYMRLLKSDPLTARIRFAWCIQTTDPFTRRADEDSSESLFDPLLDTYIPEVNETRSRWEPYYFTEHGIVPDRDKLWNYVTYSTRVAIDTPGINNRAIALDVFHQGGSGFLIWASFIWDSPEHQESNHDNPWEQPYTRWGNGAMAYFYPPTRKGVSPEIDLTITPSLRVETYRESVDDYEYAWMLEQRIAAARAAGRDTTEAQAVLDDLNRFFINAAQWSQNDAWYLALRDRMARAIVDLSSN